MIVDSGPKPSGDAFYQGGALRNAHDGSRLARMTSAHRRELQRSYESAVYEVDLAEGPAVFNPATVESASRPFVIITGYNPGIERPPPADNEAANARLEARLRSAGFRLVNACARSPDGSHVEPSFAVFDITIEASLAVARDFGQAAFFAWDGAAGSIVWCDVVVS
jgi:Protein of unknown function (DUF3293)